MAVRNHAITNDVYEVFKNNPKECFTCTQLQHITHFSREKVRYALTQLNGKIVVNTKKIGHVRFYTLPENAEALKHCKVHREVSFLSNVPMSEIQKLCGATHGPLKISYQNGSNWSLANKIKKMVERVKDNEERASIVNLELSKHGIEKFEDLEPLPKYKIVMPKLGF